MDDRLAVLRREIAQLKDLIVRQKTLLQNGGIGACATPVKPLGTVGPKKRKLLDGHFSKVYCLDWSGADSDHLITGSQDGKLILWDARTKLRECMVSLKSSTWAMTARFQRGSGRFIACGGMDNCCSVFDLSAGSNINKPAVVLAGHDGYVSALEFLDASRVVTTSGDATARLWDIPSRAPLLTFLDHASDVMCISAKPGDAHVFVTGSVDATARVWDARAGARAVQTFVGHEGDVNAIAFMSHGLSFGTGGEDSLIKIFDLRSYARVNELKNDSMVCSVTALAFSRSGRIAFGGYDDCNVAATTR